MRLYPIKGSILFFCVLTLGVVGEAGADENTGACAAAQRFAIDVAKRMRSGLSADQEFNSYGGVDAVSKSMLNIINYVHSHRVNKDVAPARIGALTLAKCNNGSFGRLSYSDLPEQYDPDYEKTNEDGETGVLPSALPGGQQDGNDQPRSVSTKTSGVAADCEMYKREIQAIDDQMRGGYSPESGDLMREKRRKYRGLINKNC